MKADAGRKYRLYPTPDVAARLVAWGHTCRAVYNLALEQRQIAYRSWRKTLRSFEQAAHLTEARADLDWIADVPAQAAQQVLRNLDRAYDNWWNPAHAATAPEFRKRRSRLSVPFPGQAVEVRELNRKWAEVRLPKIGWIKFRLSRPLGGVVRNCTVHANTSTGEFHVSFGVATGQKQAVPNGQPGVGVDFGVACSAFVSDETRPRLMRATLTAGERRRLLGLERRKARQVAFARKHNDGRYSKRLRKNIAQIAEVKARQARRRLDFTHKLTTDLVKNHGWVAIEDLQVKNMTASAKGSIEEPGANVAQKAGLNRAILDNTPYERRRQLAYKCAMYGSELALVPAPGTSQTCSACGTRDKANRPGCGRLFACTTCGHTEHADLNAAKNIAIAGAAGHGGQQHAQSPSKDGGEGSTRMREPRTAVLL